MHPSSDKPSIDSDIAAACEAAREMGVRVCRGYVFDWGREHGRPLPEACNVEGAILLVLGKQELVRGGFQRGWNEHVRAYLGVTAPWLWRFMHGWDRGNLLVVSYQKDGKDYEEKDKTSRLGDRLARQLCGPAKAPQGQDGVDQA